MRTYLWAAFWWNVLVIGIFVSVAEGQESSLPSVVPGAFTPVNLCWTEGTVAAPGGSVCDLFFAPVVAPAFGPVQFVDKSPIDPSRDILNFPNFPLAAYHHWLFSQLLFRAQRQYAQCIGELNVYNKLRGAPAVDAPGQPLYELIQTIREYEVPFHAIASLYPHRPPTLEEAKAHASVALDTYNITVAHVHLCKLTVMYLEGR